MSKENNNMCQGIFFVYDVTGSAYSRIIFRAMHIWRINTNFERNWKNSIYIKVNILAKSVNF